MNRPGVGVGIIVRNLLERKVLMGIRKDNLLLALPGGHLEKFEKPEQCASRELLEETGLNYSPEQFKVLDILNVIEKEANYHYICILVTVEHDQTQIPQNLEPEKHHDWQWVDENTIGKAIQEKSIFFGFKSLIHKQGGVTSFFNKNF